MEWGSLVGEKAPDLMNDFLLVSCSEVRRRDMVAVYNVMVMMVGNRQATGATILGGALKYITCQPSLTRWRASRGVSCCGSHYPFPRRCGDVTFSRIVTPLRVQYSYVWFEGALQWTDASSLVPASRKNPERCLKQGQKLGETCLCSLVWAVTTA